MKHNPVSSLVKKRLRMYQRTVLAHGKTARTVLNKIHPTPYNQKSLKKKMDEVGRKLSLDTQLHLVRSVDEVILETIDFYNRKHKGDKLNGREKERLYLDIRKDFLLSKFKGATVDQRLSHSEARLKENIHKGLQQHFTDYATGSHGMNLLINSITGNGVTLGGSAFKWNSRLLLSEMYRAYQFAARATLTALGVTHIQWMNVPRERPKGSLIEEYADKVFTLRDIPDYPHPCNDSYFIPIY